MNVVKGLQGASQFLRVAGVGIRYADTGNWSKKSVLLVHGLGGSIESWTKNIDAISRTHRVVACDLPGFGLSDKPEKASYTIQYYCDFVAALAKKLDLRGLTLVGSSLGGQIAAEVAIQYPEIASKLVLISPAGALPFSFKGTPALRNYIRISKARSIEQVKEALMSVDGKPVDDEYAQFAFERLSMPGAKRAILSALKGSARAKRLSGRLSKITAPTLLLWGKEDQMIPVKFIQPFMKMKNCRIILLENCGHRPHAERPELFNRIVNDFASERP